MKPVIAIPAYKVFNDARPYSPFVYAAKHTFVQAVERAGGLPLIIPMYEVGENAEQLLEIADGLLLADGNDISSEHYHEEPRDVRGNDPQRDECELKLLEIARARNMPILGVCRGMQLMNVACGGTLYQDVMTERPDTKNHDGYLEVKSTEHLAHTLRLEPGSQLASILGLESIKSNTHHHQAVKDIGPGLIANAWAEDGVIEGLEATEEPYFVGVQPHPESIFQRAEPAWLKLFQSFIDASKEYKSEQK